MKASASIGVGLVLLAALAAPAAAAEPTEAAQALAEEALALFKAERFEEAAQRFRAAFDLTGKPAPLYNAARAYERASRPDLAAECWRRYLELKGVDEPRRAQVRARLDELARIARPLEERDPGRSPAISVAPDDPPPPRDEPGPRPAVAAPRAEPGPPVGEIVLLGASAAAIATGVGLVLSGWGTYWSFAGASDAEQTVTRADLEAASTRAGVGYAIGGAGALALGATLLYLGLAPDSAWVGVAPDGALWAGARF